MCSSLFVVAYVQTLLFFFFFIYCIFRSYARILLTTIFFCKLCTIFRSTLFINLLSTHIHCHCSGPRTHTKIKSSFSPSLRLPNSTQKLRSCYAISARFKVHYTHTHGRRRRSWSSPFCLGFTPIAPPSRPLLGNFSSFCNPCDDDELSVTSSDGGRRTLSLPLCSPFFHFLPLLHKGQLGP